MRYEIRESETGHMISNHSSIDDAMHTRATYYSDDALIDDSDIIARMTYEIYDAQEEVIISRS